MNLISRQKSTVIFIIFLILLFSVNLLQSLFTEIHCDEAYYALYGKYLAWGYFDHPPMVALMIRISSLLFTGNLGVRFLTLITQLGCILLIWNTIDKNKRTAQTVINLFVISFSSVMFSAYGFITTPDSPLLFFTALFLYGYKRFLDNESWMATVLLTLAATGLIYSKYQGALLILFVILSNVKLLKSGKFWVGMLGAIILLLPHILWQFDNHFPTVKYHIVSRSKEFEWSYLLEYIPNQLVVFNPFVLGAVGYILYKYKAQNLLERALYFVIVGFLGFFFLSSFRGHVEPHWTISASIAMIFIIVNRSVMDKSLQVYIKRIILPSILLVLVARVLLTTTLLPEHLMLHSKQKEYSSIHNVAGKNPVVFSGSFQNPSLYLFFFGGESTVISNLTNRMSQFDIWDFQKQLQGKRVLVCPDTKDKYKIFDPKTGLNVEGFFADSLQTTNHIIIDIHTRIQDVNPSQLYVMNISLYNPYNKDFYMNHRLFPVDIQLVLLHKGDVINIPATVMDPFPIITSHQSVKTRIKFRIPQLDEGHYDMGVSLNSFFGLSLNSKFEVLIVRK